MKKIYFILMCASLFISCQTGRKSFQQENVQKEKPALTEAEILDALFTSLQDAVINEDTEVLSAIIDSTPPAQVKKAINRKMTVGGSTLKSQTLLYYSVCAEHPELVELLLSAGADKNSSCVKGQTPAQCALELAKKYPESSEYQKICKLFGLTVQDKELPPPPKDSSAQNEQDASQEKNTSNLSMSSSYGVVFGTTNSKFLKAVKEENYTAVKQMLQNGQDVNETDMMGNNALFYAIESQNDTIINILISYSINCNRQNKQGQIPFLLAVDKGNIAEITTLLKAGANINKSDLSGVSAAGIAVSKRNTSLLKFLVSKGASVYGKNSEGNTLLHFAIQNEDLSTTRFLLEEDCDVYEQNDRGVTPLDLLKKSKREELQNLAKEYE